MAKNKIEITSRKASGRPAGDEKMKVNLTLTTFNMMANMLTVSFIGFPYAFKEGGVGFSILMLIITALVSVLTIYDLHEAAKLTGTHNYMQLMEKVFGKPGYILASISLGLCLLTMMVSLNVIMSDLGVVLVKSLSEKDLTGRFIGSRGFIILVVSVFLTAPLSLYGTIKLYSAWSLISLSAKVVLIVFVGVRLSTLDIPDTANAFEFISHDAAQAIAIFATSQLAHLSVFIIFDAMQFPTDERVLKVTEISFGVTMAMNILLGLLGYATFTGNTQGNVLQNYCHDDVLMNVGRLLFLISSVLVFPLKELAAHQVLEQTLFRTRQPPPLYRHFVITLLLVAAAAALSLLTDCLGVVLEINGVLFAVPLAFIYPPVISIRLRTEENRRSRFMAAQYAILAFGVALFIVGLYTTVDDLVKGITCFHGEEPAFCSTP